jgi:hypothetical protein
MGKNTKKTKKSAITEINVQAGIEKKVQIIFSTARSQNVENQHEKEGPRFSGSLSLF